MDDRHFVGATSALTIIAVGGLIPCATYLAARRFQNQGASGWWAVGLLVPLLNLYVGLRALSLPEGYSDHRTLDATAKAIIAFAVFTLVSGVALAITVPMFLGSPATSPSSAAALTPVPKDDYWSQFRELRGQDQGVGELPDTGLVSTKSFAEQLEFAEKGDAKAQNWVAKGYRNGWAVDQDYAAAIRWYVLSADQGHAPSQAALAKMHLWGYGVPPDEAEAAHLFRLAANQENAEAQYALGRLRVAGRGVAQDDAKAFRWFRLAGYQGHAVAQYWLGLMYDTGRSVPQDYAQAAHWYRLAANQGVTRAQYQLGLMLRDGEGVPQDYVETHMWLNLAAAGATAEDRDEFAKERDRFAKADLTQAQIAEAQRLAREWKPTDQR